MIKDMIRKNQRCISPVEMQIIINSRIFWREQAAWIKSFIDAEYFNLEISEEIFSHLYNIPAKFSNSLRLIFGGVIAEQYGHMLSQNIVLIRELIEAQEDNDVEAMNQIVNDLYLLADQRAAYLDSINPFWDENQWRNLLYTYLYLTIQQGNALLLGDYDGCIRLFDRLLVHADLMGDYFSSGLYSYLTLMSPYANQQRIEDPTEPCITYEMMNLIYNIRLSWMDLALWTRNYAIFSTVNHEYAEQAYNKLRQIPMQYDDLLKTVFDAELVDELTAVVYEQVDLINALITSQMVGDIEEANKVVHLLYQNIDKRADVNARMNPYINRDSWKNILHNYMDATISEIVSYLAGDYERNIAIFQRLIDQTELVNKEFSEAMVEYLLQNNKVI